MAQWIPSNIEKADKILVVLTPRYLLALQSSTCDASCDDVEFIGDVCKVHCETNFINNAVYNITFSPKDVISIRRDVGIVQLPSILENYHSVQFPDRFDQKDPCFRDLIGALLNHVPHPVD